MEVHPKWAQLRPRQRNLSPELKAELADDIVAAYRRTKNIRDVATYVNRSYKYVRTVLIEHNVPLMPVGHPGLPSQPGAQLRPDEKRRLRAVEKLMTSTIINPRIKKEN